MNGKIPLIYATKIHADDHSHLQAHADAAVNYTDDEEHSVLEHDSKGEE